MYLIIMFLIVYSLAGLIFFAVQTVLTEHITRNQFIILVILCGPLTWIAVIAFFIGEWIDDRKLNS